MSRTEEQLRYHAAKEREYRIQRNAERYEAQVALMRAADLLRAHGYSLGRILDLIVQSGIQATDTEKEEA